jgi:uncharacterized paraquat-inducible protein A
MKKTKFCYSCDTEFTVIAKGQDQVLYCPFCAESLDADEEVFEDETENDY